MNILETSYFIEEYVKWLDKDFIRVVLYICNNVNEIEIDYIYKRADSRTESRATLHVNILDFTIWAIQFINNNRKL